MTMTRATPPKVCHPRWIERAVRSAATVLAAVLLVSAANPAHGQDSAHDDITALLDSVIAARDTAPHAVDTPALATPALPDTPGPVAVAHRAADTTRRSRPVVLADTQAADSAGDTALAAASRPRRPAFVWVVLSRLGYRAMHLGPVVWLHRYALRLLVLALSAAAIGGAVAYHTGLRERQRFLTSDRLSIMDKEVQKACRHVEKHSGDPGLTPDTLCEALVTGRAFLEALFERELGMSVGDLIEQVRVHRCRALLAANPLLPIAELASASGFGAADDVAAAFAKVLQCSVEEYRASLTSGRPAGA
jgi:AraC-like DNA-binding protein